MPVSVGLIIGVTFRTMSLLTVVIAMLWMTLIVGSFVVDSYLVWIATYPANVCCSLTGKALSTPIGPQKDVILSKFMSVATKLVLPWVSLHTVLSGGIPHVGKLVSKKQVRRIATGRIIAMMTYVQPLWDGTMCNFPRKSVGKGAATGIVGSATDTHVSIPPWRVISGIRPTRIRSCAAIYLAPKTFFNRLGLGSCFHNTPPVCVNWI